MKNIGNWGFVLLLATGTLLYLTGRLQFRGAGASSPPHAEHAGEEGEHHEETSRLVDGKVVLDAEVVLASRIRTAPAAKGSVAVTLNLAGEVKLAEDRVAHVTPRIPGSIREVHKAVGEPVAAGEPVCTIESVELGEARADFISAGSEKTLADRNHNRWKELFEKGLKTQTELWAAENESIRAGLRLESAGSKLKALGMSAEEIEELGKEGGRVFTNRYVLRSPIAGVVLDRHATLGESVEAKDQLFLVADLSTVWVQAALYEKDLASVRSGMPASVRTLAIAGTAFPGTVSYVGRQVDEKVRTVPVRIVVPNPAVQGSTEPYALRPGMFANVDLEIARREDALVVPLDAVQMHEHESVVFVRTGAPAPAPRDEHGHAEEGRGHEKNEPPHDVKEAKSAEGGPAAFERRPVALGIRDAGVVEVVSGLKPGEEVVVENAYLLKSEFERARISEGHAH